MKHFTLRSLLVALSLGVSLVASAGDGTKLNPFTPTDVKNQGNSLVTNGAVYLRANVLGYGNDLQTPTATPADRDSILAIGDSNYRLLAIETQLSPSQAFFPLALKDAASTDDLLFYGNFELRNGTLAFRLSEIHGAFHIDVPASGYTSFWCNGNWSIPNEDGVLLHGISVSKTTLTKKDFTYNTFKADTTIVGGNSSTGFIVEALPNKRYDVVLTAKSPNPARMTNILTAGQVGTSKVVRNRNAYKFVIDGRGLGFEGSTTTPTTVDLSSKTEIFITLSEQYQTALNLSSSNTYVSFTKARTLPTSSSVTGIEQLAAPKAVASGIYGLDGRYYGSSQNAKLLNKGIYIIDGKKIIVK